jgi:uncharacterized protein DUF4440
MTLPGIKGTRHAYFQGQVKGTRVEYFSTDRIEAVAHRGRLRISLGGIVMAVQEQTSDKELCDLARRMGEAEKDRDEAFFKTLLADKLTFRRASGVVVDKETFLKDLRNPVNTYETLESEALRRTSMKALR